MADEPNPAPQPDPAQTFKRLLEKKDNDAMALASQLFDENFQLRTKNRELTDKLPKDGTVVLPDEDAKKYQAYLDLGVDPKDLKKIIDSVPELEKQNKELSGMESIRELADVGLDGSKLKIGVLKDQLAKYPDAALRFETKKDKEGNESKVAFIKEQPDAKEVPFTEFAAERLADYLPALKVTAAQPVPKPGNGPDPKPAGPSVNDEAAKAAQAGMARATRNAF